MYREGERTIRLQFSSEHAEFKFHCCMRHVHLSVEETMPRGKINVRATSWRFAPKNKVVVKTSFESMLFMNVDTLRVPRKRKPQTTFKI